MVRILLLMLLAGIISDYYLHNPKSSRIWNRKLKVIAMHGLRYFTPLVLLLIVFGELTLELFIVSIILPFFYIIINSIIGEIERRSTAWNRGHNPFSRYKSCLYSLELLLKASLLVLAYSIIASGGFSALTKIVMDFLVGPSKIYDSEVKLIFIAIVLACLIRVCSHAVALIIADLGQSYSSTAQQEIAAATESHPIIDKFIQATPYGYSKDSSIEETLEFREQDAEHSQIEIVRKVSKQHNNYVNDPNSMGTYIGIIERVLIAFFVVNLAYTAIAFIGAVKTLARFKQFEDRRFAEYYLLGTLLSALFGFAGGFLMTRVL